MSIPLLDKSVDKVTGTIAVLIVCFILVAFLLVSIIIVKIIVLVFIFLVMYTGISIWRSK